VHGSPLKVFEYLALGKPIVMAATGSGLEPLRDARAGEIVAKGEFEALAAAAQLRLQDDALREAEGARGLTWVSANGTWTETARKMVRRFVEEFGERE
jgi:glycosyltransferase involved in cell wall biosynthesis